MLFKCTNPCRYCRPGCQALTRLSDTIWIFFHSFGFVLGIIHEKAGGLLDKCQGFILCGHRCLIRNVSKSHAIISPVPSSLSVSDNMIQQVKRSRTFQLRFNAFTVYINLIQSGILMLWVCGSVCVKGRQRRMESFKKNIMLLLSPDYIKIALEMCEYLINITCTHIPYNIY